MIAQGKAVDLIALLLIYSIVYLSMQRAKRVIPVLKSLPALEAFEEAVGRGVETNRPIVYGTGWGGGGMGGLGAQSQTALVGLDRVSRLTARLGAGLVTPSPAATMMPLLSSTVEGAYKAENKPEEFRENMVQFIPNRGLSWAIGYSSLMERENPAAHICIGRIFSSFIMVVESANKVGAIQIIGAPDVINLAFVVAAADYVLIGEEMFAAGAIMSESPVMRGSIMGQDIGKIIIMILLLVGSILTTINIPWLTELLSL